MFESLQEGLRRAFKTLAGKGKLTEANMREGLDLVRDALVEADVSYPVVKDFLAKVSERALGERVVTSLQPTQQLLTIIRDELVKLLGPVDTTIPVTKDLAIVMMCGLQGAGKTTTCAKLAKLILDRQPGIKPLLVAADLQRPAAVEQLRVLGEQIGVPVYLEAGSPDPVAVCQNAVKHARTIGAKIVILDTAGRLHVDDELMRQLQDIDKRVSPDQVFLVVDGATGQDAVNSAKAFHEALTLNGVIMTKLDGDARGGATLSVKHITGVPIKFVGTGEHIHDLTPFEPERMATRLLGGGDLGELIEKAQRVMDAETQAELQKKLAQGQFTLDDFRKQIRQVQMLGSVGKLMDLIPGMGQAREMMKGIDGDKEIRRMCGIIDSMTAAERKNPTLLDQARRRRVAAGSGVEPQEVNALVKQFEAMQAMMQNVTKLGFLDRVRAMQQMTQGGLANPAAGLAKPKGSTGKRVTADERKQSAKDREKELRKLRQQRKNK